MCLNESRVGRKAVVQVGEIMKGTVATEVSQESTLGFWVEKIPCWETFHCSQVTKDDCPAFRYRDLPCWEVEGTYCKLFDCGARDNGNNVCQACSIYKRWGHGEAIQIKLTSKEFNAIAKVAL